VLREFSIDDLDAIVRYESDSLVVQYVCYGPSTRAECEQELRFHLAQQQAQPRIFYHLALSLPEPQTMIGWCGIKMAHPHDQEGELGYALDRAYWGQGYMPEAATTMLAFGFQQLHLHRIFGTCHPANHASIRVLEKIGMSYEGCLRENRWCKGVWRSTNVYAILEHEWRARMIDRVNTIFNR
jgi:ribosomal-protein-alanine N-acetyltransferase